MESVIAPTHTPEALAAAVDAAVAELGAGNPVALPVGTAMFQTAGRPVQHGIQDWAAMREKGYDAAHVQRLLLKT